MHVAIIRCFHGQLTFEYYLAESNFEFTLQLIYPFVENLNQNNPHELPDISFSKSIKLLDLGLKLRSLDGSKRVEEERPMRTLESTFLCNPTAPQT